jgi:hypothetical protein
MAVQEKHAQFEGNEGSTFAASKDDESVDLKLVEVVEHDQEQMRGFTLLFEGPADNPLSQGLIRVAHDAAGEHDLFVTPVQADPHATDVIHYEAVFNELKDKEE